ncbi:type IV secretion system DNA-binding domain-containing protein [Massilia sp. R2A-15]|uniref:type IV secretion system DNA-binding domain-containing protein n=1 Tax=Massilia sp. R2A-15 TaxID=3064278 RepID=UPI0027377171|nr:type IV secretion system DNA-binding domain-containing protein [Massilia sp. R2A-15]WLI87830.1 type IV secretion system DNA-binding domain-containing protein [Massilia sp. R2A-15]
MSAGEGRYDDRAKGYLFLLMVAMVVVGWVWGVKLIYTIPPSRVAAAYWYAMLATPGEPRLWILPGIGFASGFAIFVTVNQYLRTGFGGANYLYKLRGPKMVSAAELKDNTQENVPQLSIAGIPIPTRTEREHLSVTGSTGSGKSQAIAEYIESALARGDRIICIDPNGGFMQHFYREGEVILNPFDQRGEAWSIFNEIVTAYDVTQFAVSIIPRSPSTEQEGWNAMARTITSEVMLKLAASGAGTTEMLVYWLTIASNEGLQAMLADTSAAGMFHGADETLGSVRAVLTQYITPHKFLSAMNPDEAPFSIRDWLANGNGNMWVTWREDMLQSLKPLISCWVDVICAASLSTDAGQSQVLHLIVDELDSLEKLNYMGAAATKGRKHGFRILPGIQSYAQLDQTYGKNDATTLKNSFRNTLSLGISEMDTYTAEEISKGLGEHEVVRMKKSVSTGGIGSGSRASTSRESVRERLVLPSEIHTLPDLHGYLKFAGDIALARVRVRYQTRPVVVEPLLLIAAKWTTPISVQRAGKPLFGGGDALV